RVVEAPPRPFLVQVERRPPPLRGQPRREVAPLDIVQQARTEIAADVLAPPGVAGRAPQRIREPPEPLVVLGLLPAGARIPSPGHPVGPQMPGVRPFTQEAPVRHEGVGLDTECVGVRRRVRESRIELEIAAARYSRVPRVPPERLAPPRRST